ncbi:hypothetical protein BGZ72_002939 [Mortierella alpina]|nr:hypothetical protein BGZ72_002939 [Mortierella alpina]
MVVYVEEAVVATEGSESVVEVDDALHYGAAVAVGGGGGGGGYTTVSPPDSTQVAELPKFRETDHERGLQERLEEEMYSILVQILFPSQDKATAAHLARLRVTPAAAALAYVGPAISGLSIYSPQLYADKVTFKSFETSQFLEPHRKDVGRVSRYEL